MDPALLQSAFKPEASSLPGDTTDPVLRFIRKVILSAVSDAHKYKRKFLRLLCPLFP